MSDEEREYLNETIKSLNNQLVDALRERDEARREVCRNEANHLPTMVDPRREAKRRGWDCFKEDSK